MSSCPTDAQLRLLLEERLPAEQQTLSEAHLETCTRCREILDELTGLGAPSPETPASAILQRPWHEMLAVSAALLTKAGPGLSATLPAIPGYEVLQEVGRGGMGVVYKARQLALNRLVALKMILSAELSSIEQQQRFRQEAELAARVHHPNIVQVYEVGACNGRPFLAMEWLEGGTLTARLAGGPMAPQAAAELMEVLAHAVHAAHCQGVLHRDLKPANVLMASGVPKIVDFGLARSLVGRSGLTVTGVISGTPEYMAPELAAGHSRHAGPTADVYSLGACLYELLTGQPPFSGATPLETLQQVLGNEPVVPRALQAQVPRDVMTICLRCLEKDVKRRYCSAEALADDLRRFRNGEPIRARPVGPLERAWKWARRRPAPAALLLLVLLVTALGFPGVTFLWLSAAAARERARTGETAAVLARNDADAERNRSRQQLADLYLERGLGFAHQGEVSRGMHWMLEALRTAPEGSTDFRRVVRTNLAGWSQHLLAPAYFLPVKDIRSVAFSPDGKTLAVGDFHATVRFFEALTGKQILATIDTGSKHVIALAFSPDGRRLLTGCAYHFGMQGGPQSARVWDVASGQALGPPLTHADVVPGVAWSPDGNLLLTGSWDRTAQLWRADTGEKVGAPWRSDHKIHAVAFGGDGRRAVTVSAAERNAVQVWDLGHSPPLPTPVELGVSGAFRRTIALSPDGRTIVVAGGSALVAQRWAPTERTKEGQPIRLMRGGVVGFLPDGRGLAALTADARLMVLEFAAGRPRVVSVWHPCLHDEVALAVSPDGRSLATHAGVWRLPRPLSRLIGRAADVRDGAYRKPQPLFVDAAFRPDGRQVALSTGAFAELRDTVSGRRLPGPPFAVARATFSPDGRLLATCKNGWPDGDYTVRLWDVAVGRQVGPPLPDRNNVRVLAFSRDSKTLVTGGLGKQAHRWDASTGQPLGKPLGGGDLLPEAGLDISPAGDLLAMGSHLKGKGSLWDLQTGKQRGAPIPDTFRVRFSPDGQTLLCWDGSSARLWDVATLRPITPPLGYGAILDLAGFSPDGRLLLTVGRNGTARLWEAQTGKPVGREMTGPEGPTSAVFRTDGQVLLIGYADGTAQLWDVATTLELGPPVAQAHRILNVAWAPDGRSFFTAAADGSLRRWPVPGATEARLEQLTQALEVLTAARMNAGQVVSPLRPEEWGLLREAWGTAGEVFAAPIGERAWHDARARDAEEEGEAFAVRWHRERL